ncbi:MAG: Na+/H+ antiporter NhaC family protein [Verrucomicrobiota bacterium]
MAPQLSPLAPPLFGLACLLLSRSTIAGLFAGSLLGVALLPHSFWDIPWLWLSKHAFPSLQNSWHLSSIAFTLQLAAFAAILERSGALHSLLARWNSGQASREKFQLSIIAIGFICFFDGLANALMLGRVGSRLADQVRVTREKLAYLVDTTSSAIACIAFLSTWSVFQLNLINEALKDSSVTTPAYLLFLQSIPANFYCLLSLVLAILSARYNWNPPPMSNARPQPILKTGLQTPPISSRPLLSALGPLLILLLSVPLAFWLLGRPNAHLLPRSFEDLQLAMATNKGPLALILAGSIALLGAIVFFNGPRKLTIPASLNGIRSILPAIIVLLLAWTLNSTLTELKTGQLIAQSLGESLDIRFLPVGVFLAGCFISFSTGSSWGTMTLLMPLALGTALAMGDSQQLPQNELQSVILPVIGAVFGGAVFGDHASPFSDTTIVSSIACQIETTSHVLTQLPYALLAGTFAITFGYLPFAFGLPIWLGLLTSTVAVFLVVRTTKKRFAQTNQSTS